jgi:hypothetical protein
VKSTSCPDNDLDLFKHVLEFNQHYANQKAPKEWDDAQKCRDFISKYLLPIPVMPAYINPEQYLFAEV